MANSSLDYIKNVAIIGASGSVGSQVFKALFESQKFNITVITRPTTSIIAPPDSSTQDRPQFKVLQGSYDDKEFLGNALKGIEVLVLALGFTAVGQYQVGIIEAAVNVGVEWILPTEYSGDSGNDGIRKVSDSLQNKTPSREAIERLGGKWIGVVTGLWLGLVVKFSMIGINTANRTATLYDNGTTKLNFTNLPLIGIGITHLLSLPINPPSNPTSLNNKPPTTLSSYTNKFIYIRSHHISQLEILQSIQRHTKTSDLDWKIEYASAQDFIDQGEEKGFRGEIRGWSEAYLGMCLLEDAGGDFDDKAVRDMEALGLLGLEGELDEWVAKALEK